MNNPDKKDIQRVCSVQAANHSKKISDSDHKPYLNHLK